MNGARQRAWPLLLLALLGTGCGPGHRWWSGSDEYLELLEREDRAEWQRPEAVVAALDPAADAVIYDLGAGSGYFSFRFARAVPEGRVVATEIEEDFVRYMQRKAYELALTNVEVRLTDPDDPGVAADADLVFVCNVLHHVEHRAAWLAAIHAALRPGARFALVEFKPGDLPVGPDDDEKLPREQIVAELRGAGFTGPTEIEDVLPYQWLLVFER